MKEGGKGTKVLPRGASKYTSPLPPNHALAQKKWGDGRVVYYYHFSLDFVLRRRPVRVSVRTGVLRRVLRVIEGA